MSDYFCWLQSGDLSLDIDIMGPTGETEAHRITIPRARMAKMLSATPEGIRFFLREVVTSMAQKVEIPRDIWDGIKSFRKEALTPNGSLTHHVRADDILGPDLIRIENRIREMTSEKE